ncbi:hypothetical protein A6770_15880 [Nostoc minutum NIES-26]|uniref:Uncharacterized protein n=1 Tax=Nostoc minutum NIES-26 TaxID=1844469 RepID=A0A367RMH3_9NOSO|nr:hypothetical protein A6770_15880 [Nostoc minutum NIES-26]
MHPGEKTRVFFFISIQIDEIYNTTNKRVKGMIMVAYNSTQFRPYFQYQNNFAPNEKLFGYFKGKRLKAKEMPNCLRSPYLFEAYHKI